MSILAILAIIGGVYAMVQPMQQQIDYIKNDLAIHKTSDEEKWKCSDDKHLKSVDDRGRMDERLNAIIRRLNKLEGCANVSK